ncbi:hypothetical protein ACHAXT_000407 [Thalassiosira profunda]
MSNTPEEHERQLGDPATAAAAPTTDANPAEASPGTPAKPEEEAPATGARPSTTVTPAEYILSTMIPLKPPAEEEELVSPGKRERASTGGSSGSGARLMSMDLNLSSGDIVMDGGLSALNSDDAMMHLKSADVVKKIILPDTATTAAAALGAEQLPQAPISEDLKPPSLEARQEGEDGFCPIVSLTAKLERISTGEEIAPLGENFRMSSRDWVKDFADEASGDLGPMHPSLFMGSPDVVPSAPPLDPSSINDEQFEVPLQSPGNQPMPPVPPLSNANVIDNLPRSLRTTRSSLKAKSPSSSTASKKKRRRKRDIDLTRAVDPTDDDVLFGRGGYSNQHPGNIRFREKAMELRPWYEAATTTKEEKYRISELLVESVKSEGHRFLEKGEDGLWHEVIGNGARKKASQALRERIKGTRRTKGTASSIRSSASQGSASQGGLADFTVEDVVGDLQPASVEGV